MAFKMKGSAFYGKGNQSPMKATGDPKKSEQAVDYLLGSLGKYGTGEEGDPVKEKRDRDVDLGGARYSDLPSTAEYNLEGGDDPKLNNPRNKKEIDRRLAVAKEKQAEGRAQSMGDYVKETSTTQAADATKARVKEEEAAAKAAEKAEKRRRGSLGKKGREKEDKDIEKANKENNKALEKAARKGGDQPVFKKTRKASALKEKDPKKKSYLQRAYDKASQVGMGVRSAASAMFDDEASQRRIYSGATLDIGKHYRKGRDAEKRRDDGTKDAKLKNKSAVKAKGDPKKRKNYSKNVIDASSKRSTRGLNQNSEYVKGFKRDAQRTMSQDRSKLSKDDLRTDELQVEGSETKKGEKYMTKVMAPKSVKSKPTASKTLMKKKKKY